MKLLGLKPYRGNLLYHETPVGRVGLVENGSALTHLFFGDEKDAAGFSECQTPLLLKAASQLDEYFTGDRLGFDLPLAPFGTDFQRLVWSALLKIGYGRKTSYGQVAENIGHPGASRAVGQANNRNPIALIIPCHRVVGRNGEITGYAGGLAIKEYLLKLEDSVFCGRAGRGL